MLISVFYGLKIRVYFTIGCQVLLAQYDLVFIHICLDDYV